MAFKIKGQTKATVAFKGKFSVYGPILFKLCVEVAYWHSLMFCYMAFTIKGQIKAAVAFKGKFSVTCYKTSMSANKLPPHKV